MCTNNIFNTCHQAWTSPNGPNPTGLQFNQQNCEQLCPNWPGISSYGSACESGVRRWCQCNGIGSGPLPSFCSPPPACTSQDKSDVVGACLDTMNDSGMTPTAMNAMLACPGELNNNPRFPRAQNCSEVQQDAIVACADYTERNPNAVPSYCNWKCAQPGPCRLCNDASENKSEQCDGRGVQGYQNCIQSCGH